MQVNPAIIPLFPLLLAIQYLPKAQHHPAKIFNYLYKSIIVIETAAVEVNKTYVGGAATDRVSPC